MILLTMRNRWTVQASSFVSSTSAVAYLSPILAGMLADGFLGDYWEILLGISLFYIPGLLLIALTAYPHLLGETFNIGTLVAGTLVLWPLGAGSLKSTVNVFGAKQYHPILQQKMLEAYYVQFYMAMNTGALVGGILIPVLAEVSVQAAYTIPVCVMGLGLIGFVVCSRRYVRVKPDSEALGIVLKLIGKRVFLCRPLAASKQSNGGHLPGNLVDGVKRLLLVIPISALTIPFCIVYFQLATVFVIQGNAMEPMSFIDASMMNNFDAISVIIFGYIIGSKLYPFLSKRYDITIPPTTKFAIGTGLAGVAVLCNIVVDHVIHSTYQQNGGRVNILWQSWSYIFVGAAKIFCFATVYDVAFQIAPKEYKGLSSSLMILVSGACGNFISVGLYNAFADWFPRGTTLEDYSSSQVHNYLWVIFSICGLSVIVNLLPPVRHWVSGVLHAAIQAGTPNSPLRSSQRHSSSSTSISTEIVSRAETSRDGSEEGV